MKIYLVRSPELRLDIFNKTVEVLQRYKGITSFLPTEVPPEILASNGDFRQYQDTSVCSWKQLFNLCESFRNELGIQDTDWVIFLTDKHNALNWFSAGEEGRYNFFIHTSHWDKYVKSEYAFPIAYEVAALILQRLMFNSYKELKAHAHYPPKGCIMDICVNKQDISLKMRTADICEDCQKQIKEKDISPQVLQQVQRIFENIRGEMLLRSVLNYSRYQAALKSSDQVISLFCLR